MESFAKLISSLASLAWPIFFSILSFVFYEPLKKIIESARGRRFTIKVAGHELTMEEVSEQQRIILSDLQQKVAEIEKKIDSAAKLTEPSIKFSSPTGGRILWVDDQPRNNSLLVATLEQRGAMIDTAQSTSEGVDKFKSKQYDIVISDMGRPESDKAGIDLAMKIRNLNPTVPFFIYCGSWAARNLKKEALDAGVTTITASGTTLLGSLPLANGG